MAEKRKPLYSRVWSGLGHISRALWVYHLFGAFSVSAVTVLAGFKSVQIAYLIPLTVGAFGGTLYVINQVTLAVNRARQGYAYGLAYEGIFLGFSPDTPEMMLQFGILIRNATDRPLRYEVEQFDVVIGDRTIANPIFASSGTLIPRNAQRRYSYPSFRRDQIETFIDKNPQGVLTFALRYGHPDGPLVRRLKMKISLSLHLESNKAAVGDSILSESDEAI